MINLLPTKLWMKLTLSFILLLLLAGVSVLIYQSYNRKEVPSDQRGLILETKTEDGKVIPPQPDEKPMKIAINEAKAENGKLQVALTVENRGHIGFEKLMYYASLVGKSEESKSPEGNILVLPPTPIAQIMSPPFPLKSGKVEKFQFELQYPVGAPSGEYDLKVEVRPMEDTSYGLETQKVSLIQAGYCSSN